MVKKNIARDDFPPHQAGRQKVLFDFMKIHRPKIQEFKSQHFCVSPRKEILGISQNCLRQTLSALRDKKMEVKIQKPLNFYCLVVISFWIFQYSICTCIDENRNTRSKVLSASNLNNWRTFPLHTYISNHTELLFDFQSFPFFTNSRS